jgi:hypothetical protein
MKTIGYKFLFAVLIFNIEGCSNLNSSHKEKIREICINLNGTSLERNGNRLLLNKNNRSVAHITLFEDCPQYFGETQYVFKEDTLCNIPPNNTIIINSKTCTVKNIGIYY